MALCEGGGWEGVPKGVYPPKEGLRRISPPLPAKTPKNQALPGMGRDFFGKKVFLRLKKGLHGSTIYVYS
ncbi:MAG: hypothetical protein DRP66_00950 [Planctomycetota bacterium]|nr:MAG: hypothetical protein DRP66_00950 [Planctomycetota bacterium]